MVMGLVMQVLTLAKPGCMNIYVRRENKQRLRSEYRRLARWQGP